MAEAVMEIVDGGRRAAALLHPMRLRLLENLREPDSSSLELCSEGVGEFVLENRVNVKVSGI